MRETGGAWAQNILHLSFHLQGKEGEGALKRVKEAGGSKTLQMPQYVLSVCLSVCVVFGDVNQEKI